MSTKHRRRRKRLLGNRSFLTPTSAQSRRFFILSWQAWVSEVGVSLGQVVVNGPCDELLLGFVKGHFHPSEHICIQSEG